ncbi:putative amidohydrolase [Talaromyces proteolyticus]|uniref:Peptidase M20 domain-containing protein 2 n=1 Tax=Talaromyces proteolyticus TaxID=1131652 RepID=A0AAD4KM35_9EURO|nr:putative amidohydrolase [Talaromyces proteolyticus]KAH8691602.1 putative amidohydrolase [Talaromyces proteolyticus]
MSSSNITPHEIAEVKAVVDAAIEELHTQLREVNRQIWSNPELAYQEHHAHDTICNFLEAQEFQVTRHAYGLETAFEARSSGGSEDGVLVNFNAEYDALPEIGHACGHNLIATSSIAAFVALSTVLKKFDIPGRTQLLGTPAEENGGGKVKLIENGAYKGVDISLMAHGGPSLMGDGIAGVLFNARKQIHVEFTGKNAHAGGNPWEGINALDALVAAYSNIAVLRQQILPEERIHCAFLETPKVANVIPSHTKAYWQVRSPTLAGLNKLTVRVRNCIDAAALATGCQVKMNEDSLYTDIKLNDTLCERYQAHMGRYDRSVIKSIDKVMTASSDIGNVSYVVPTLHSMFTIHAPEGAYPHHPSFAAAAGTDVAHEEALLVGKALALTGWDMLANADLLQQAKQQWQKEINNDSPHDQQTFSRI